MYQDLINILQKIKSEKQINEQLLEQLTDATVGTHMAFYLKEEGTNPFDALGMIRMTLLNYLDGVLLDLHGVPGDDFDLDSIKNFKDSPMTDKLFKDDITKAIDAYNKRIS